MMSKTRFMGATLATRRVSGQVRGARSGQVTVEYVLLLVVGIVIWMAISQGLVSRSPNSPGLVIQEWRSIIQFIGNDTIEK